MRTDELFIVEVDDISLNNKKFTEIHIPINHINFDANNNCRSSFRVEDIAKIIINLLNGQMLEADGSKDESMFYVYYFELNKKNHKLVFETKNNKAYIRVITFHRVR